MLALRADLLWLGANAFTRLDWTSDEPIQLGDAGPAQDSSCHGGYPALGDRRNFIRLFTLLRYVLKQPFDAPADPLPSSDGGPLYQHLIERISDLEGAYTPAQESMLRNDLRHVLRPYGFSPDVKGRPASVRHGFAFGTALLSADQVLEVHDLLVASMGRLSDASTKPLLTTLQDRLRSAWLLDEQMQQRRPPNRALAHRSFTEVRPGTLATADQSQRLEQAIIQQRRVWLRHEPELPQTISGAAGMTVASGHAAAVVVSQHQLGPGL